MKRFYLVVLAAVLVLSAILSIRAYNQEKSPRMKCLEGCQATHIACVAKAKDANGNSDPNKTSACTKALNDCLKTCPQNP